MMSVYDQYYLEQVGSGRVFKGVPYQRGHGLGSFLSSIYRGVLPLIKSGARYLGKEVLNAGIGTLDDWSQGKRLKDAGKERFTDVGKNVLRKLQGSGMKRKRLQSQSKRVKRKKSPKLRDIFDN